MLFGVLMSLEVISSLVTWGAPFYPHRKSDSIKDLDVEPRLLLDVELVTTSY